MIIKRIRDKTLQNHNGNQSIQKSSLILLIRCYCRLGFLICFSFFTITSNAQQPLDESISNPKQSQIQSQQSIERVKFNPVTFDLKTSSYGAVLQDKDGFFWFGTVGKGAFRYDGYQLKNFSKNKQQLSGAFINSIVEDSTGLIWFGSLSEGLTRYDKSTGKFSHVRHQANKSNSLSSDHLPFSPHVLYIDSNDMLWVGTASDGLNKYNKITGTWTHFKHDDLNENTISANEVLAITEDRHGGIWVGTQQGLNYYDQKNDRWQHFYHQNEKVNSLSDDWVNVIIEDKLGDIWIGTKSGGLNRYNPSTGLFYHYRYSRENSKSLASDEVWNIIETADGNLWISHSGSNNGGLSMFDRQQQVFIRYTTSPNKMHNISSNGTVAMVQERETDALWLINSNGIVDKHDPIADSFTVYQHSKFDVNSISSNAILPITEDSTGNIWLGTFNAGINVYDPKSGRFSVFKADDTDTSSLVHSRISALLYDSSATLWVGSWGGTLTKFDPRTGKSIKHFKHDKSISHSITASERVKYILEDKDDNNILWIATIGGGLEKFDKTTETFTHFNTETGSLNNISFNNITSMLDENGHLWIATYGGGLDILDKKTGLFTHFNHNPNDSKSLNSDTLYEIYRDSSGTLWIGGKGGLSRFNAQQQNFDNFTVANGFPSDIISSILEDDNGNLWLGTIDSGLIKLDIKTENTTVYNEKNGLPSNTFYWTSRLKALDGQMWFGSAKGLISFHPNKISENTFIPPVLLTSMSRNGTELKLDSAAEKLPELNFAWQDNEFEFQFAALSFSQSQRNTFAYKLEGWDKDWYFSGANPFGRYSGLAGGSYILRLKAANSSGLWNEEGTSIRINITPPFWQQWWFYLLAISLIILLVFGIYFYIKKLNGEIKAHKEADTALLAIEKQIQRTQKMDALGKLTGGIAHDLNNLLGTILGYCDLLTMLSIQSPKQEKYIGEIIHAGERGAKLTKRLLSFSKKESDQATKVDINLLLRARRDLLEKSLTVNIRLVFELANDLWPVWLDSSDLEDAIINMTINAMHAMKNIDNNALLNIKTKNISLNTYNAQLLGLKSGDYVVLKFTDTGCGISEQEIEKIFEPFYTTKGEKGTGLGLSQVFGFIKRAKGAIDVNSTLNKGSEFILYFKRYKQQDIVDEPIVIDKQSQKIGNEIILIVDDEQPLRDIAEKILINQGYSVLTAENGEQALQVLNENKVELLFSDIIMPKMNGYQLATIVQKNYPYVSILLTSGFADLKHLETTDVNLLNSILPKPYRAEELCKTVRLILDG